MATEPQQNANDYYKHQCHSNLQRDIDNKIYDRNIPSQFLQPYLDVRPVMTKYSRLPIVDPRVQPRVQLQQQPTYNVNKVFNPGNTRSPWSGFVSNVNLESELRNQIFALQKCSQAVYVPNSTSDLYQHTIPQTSSSSQQPFQLLFKKENFNGFNPNPYNFGKSVFNNNTRNENRNLTNMKQNCNNK
jgi:hypothetical protein